jgi:hypothetical protein
MAVRPHYYSETQLTRRFKAGHICFIGRVGDEPVHLRWHFVHELYLPYLQRPLRLAPQEVWADEGYTKPSYRKAGIFGYAGNLITTHLAEMGFQRLSCAFASWNATPQHLDRERGMSPVGEVRFRKYFSRSRYFFSGRVRECGDDAIEIAAENMHSRFCQKSDWISPLKF